MNQKPNTMKIYNHYNQEVTLTEMESKVYLSIKNGEFDDCHANSPIEVSRETEIPMHQLRGVISSLDQKSIAYSGELIGKFNWFILYEQK